MSKTTHILLIVLMLIFLDAGFSLANTGVKFKYCFSDAFYHGENPLGVRYGKMPLAGIWYLPLQATQKKRI
ncbi:MAG: hypothetical protein JRF31_11140 [Deltaproteobacteria bacterium]|nr:hypothetical protein [Deltaproteobacteria bacterium]